MFSGSSFHNGMREYWLFSTSSMILCRRIVGVDRLHLGAVNHDVEHLQLAQVEHAAEHVGVAAGDGALLLDSSMVPRISSCAARMLAASSRLGRGELQQLADDELDRGR